MLKGKQKQQRAVSCTGLKQIFVAVPPLRLVQGACKVKRLTTMEEREKRNYEHTLFIGTSPQPAWRARAGQQNLSYGAGAHSNEPLGHGKAHVQPLLKV